MWPESKPFLDDVRRNQSGAVERLFEAHRSPLARMIALRLDPALARRVDASDVTQDVLIEANRRLQDYLRDPAAMPFHLWLRYIALDHIKDAYRRHRQAKRRSLDREQNLVPAMPADQSSLDLAAQFIDRELTPASAAMRGEMERRLHQAMGQLDEEDREILLMRHFEQLSNQEVAKILKVTEPAASMRCLRAQRKLRALLVPEENLSSEDGP